MHVRLISLVIAFTWTGLVSLGGGRSAYFYDTLVVRRRWLTSEEFVQDLTLSQLLPGPSFANLAVALGFRLAGWWGAAWALASVVVPGALILFALTVAYFSGALVTPGGERLLHGMGAAVVGLVGVTTWRVARSALRGSRAVLVAALTLLAVGPLGINTALVIVGMIALSGWLHRTGGRA